jgi:opacity protein-like surface antigen
MKTLNLTATAFLLASSAALSAQEGDRAYKPYLALGPTFAQGDARDLTQSSNGINSWSAEMGIEFFNPIARIHMRPNFGMAKMYGVKQPDTWPWPTYQMLAWYGGMDLVYKNPRGWPVNLTLGPSFHVWNVEQMYFAGDTNQPEQGLKFGWRGGVAYEINDNLNVELSYTMSEWKSRQGVPYQPGLNPSRPLYFSLKAFYKF